MVLTFKPNTHWFSIMPNSVCLWRKCYFFLDINFVCSKSRYGGRNLTKKSERPKIRLDDRPDFEWRHRLCKAAPRARNYFSHCSSGPPVHFTHQTLTISSFGYLLSRNKRHCYPFYYSKKKSQQEDLNSHPENKQCNAVLHVALPTAPRAVDGSNGGLTNLYLGLNHPRWIGCMQMSTRGLWLAVCKWVRTGVRNCSGINNLAPGAGLC